MDFKGNRIERNLKQRRTISVREHRLILRKDFPVDHFILTIKFSSFILTFSHEGKMLFTKGEAIVAFYLELEKLGYAIS